MFSASRAGRPYLQSNRWLSRALALAIGMAALALIVSACSPSRLTGGGSGHPIVRLDPAVPISDFELIDQHREPYRFSDAEGAIRLFYFGYTNCPDICPATLVDWRDARRELGVRAQDVRFVMVTVDPESDTPEELRRYLAAFDPTFVGLTGREDELRQAWDAFDVEVRHVYQPDSAIQHSISHSPSTFVVNDDEELVIKLAFNATTDDIVQAITQLLEER
jgi:protein SCO1